MIFLSTPFAKSSIFSAIALLIKGPPSSKARDLKSLRSYVCLSTERLTYAEGIRQHAAILGA
jgi:hypothetical protein